MRLTRRSLVCSIAITAFASTVSLPFIQRHRCRSASGIALPPRADLTPVAERLRNLIPNPESARPIGQIYRDGLPTENDTHTITQMVLASLSLDEAGLAGEHNLSLHARFVSAVRADFADERTSNISGWILSRTEAQLCALWA
jgi:hypothetical protein